MFWKKAKGEIRIDRERRKEGRRWGGGSRLFACLVAAGWSFRETGGKKREPCRARLKCASLASLQCTKARHGSLLRVSMERRAVGGEGGRRRGPFSAGHSECGEREKGDRRGRRCSKKILLALRSFSCDALDPFSFENIANIGEECRVRSGRRGSAIRG